MHEVGCQGHRCGGAPFARAGAAAHYPPDLRIEPVHMRLDVSLNIEARTLRGANTITLRGNGLDGTTLRLHAVAFEDVSVAASRPLASWTYDGSTIVVVFETPVRDGESAELRVEYGVSDPTSGLYFSAPSDAHPDAPLYAATDSESERARYWMPCVDLPSVRPTLELAIRARADLTILANGALAGETSHTDGTKTLTWSLAQRCPSYLTCFAAGDFVSHESPSFGDVPIAFFTTRAFTQDHLARSFGKTRDMLAWMTQRLRVPFPFPKYYQLALPGFGGAMENISLVSWDDVFVLDEDAATEWWRLVDQVNVHEMAHSYFGDLVVCRDFAHAWLKESWATYMEVCWFEDQLGRDERDYELYTCAGRYFAEADRRYVRPIVTREYNSSWQLYDGHLYPGGACRLHTLRGLLGDDAFWAGVTLYLQRYAGRVVETDDFRRTLEEVSGRPLGAFFDQWIHGKGYPQLKATYAWDGVQRQFTIEIEQQQVNATRGVGLFDLELELRWTTAGTHETRRVRVHDRRHAFVVPADAEPESVRIDPALRALHTLDFNPGDAMLARQLVEADDVVGRIMAARELVRTGKSVNVRRVADRGVDEPFWGVRVQIAQALAESASDAAIDALARVVARESDPLAIEAVCTAASGVRDARVASALRVRLAGPLPPRARRAALDALGAQRDETDTDTLLAASDTPGFGDIAIQGALLGLAKSRAARALPRLLRATAPEAPPRALPSALTALGVLGTALDKPQRSEVVERLVETLRDRRERVVLAAGRALVAMEATEATGALETAAGALSNQHSVVVLQMMDALLETSKRSATTREAELSALQEKVRKLEDALDKLSARFEAHVEPPAPDAGGDPPRARAGKKKASKSRR